MGNSYHGRCGLRDDCGLSVEESNASAIRKTGLLMLRASIQSGYDFEVITKTGDKVFGGGKGVGAGGADHAGKTNS